MRLEASGGFRALIVFDEFQDIGRIDGLDGLLRSHIQHQGEVASYVFAGSEPGLMRLLFETKDRPLYGSAVPMRLGRLADADLADYVARRFDASGRSVGEALNPLLALAAGHPQRAMLLAHRLWAEVAQGDEATLDDWQRRPRGRDARARAGVRRPVARPRRLRAEDASRDHPRRRLAVPHGRAAPARADEGRRPAGAAAALGHARRSRSGTAGGYAIVDPLFAAWVDRLNDRPGDRAPADADQTEPGR